MNIITAKQALRANGGANPANCSTLKHVWIPYGKRSEMIDYKAGPSWASAFSSHGDTYSVPGAISDASVIASSGNVADPGTANFGLLVAWRPDLAVGTLILGAAAANRISIGQYTGAVVGAGGTASLDAAITATDQTLIVTRSAAAAINVTRNGTQLASSTTDVGAITLGNNLTLTNATHFYGMALFVFSGDLPSNYDTVMAEIGSRFLAGNHSLPVEIESWT